VAGGLLLRLVALDLRIVAGRIGSDFGIQIGEIEPALAAAPAR